MTVLEKEIGTLFKMCSQANTSLSTVAMNEHYFILKQIEKQSKKVFALLENHVNSMHIKDYKSVITDKVMLLKMLYVILRGINLFSERGNHFIDEDPRSMGSAELARRIFGDVKLDSLSDNAPSWMKNDTIYIESLMMGIGSCHKTLLQSIVRCMVNTLTLPEFMNQKTNDYLVRFESYIMFYLIQAPANQKVYLDFI